MKFIECKLKGVFIIEPDVFRDSRGFFLESYHIEKFKGIGIEAVFVQDNHSKSSNGILRGLHIQLQNPQGKLIRVVEGEIYDVAVDGRRGSPTFQKWEAFRLSSENFRQIYLPPGFLHGFLVLSEIAQVEYKCTSPYHAESDTSVVWNDSDLKIDWPVKNPVLSKKDASGKKWADVAPKLPLFKG